MSTGHNADSWSGGSTREGDVPVDAAGHRTTGLSKEEVYAREQREHGGMKFGAAFFGWLTSVGALLFLLAIAAGIASLIGAAMGGIDQVASGLTGNLQTAGIWSAVIGLIIWFVAYYCGGYVAGRMARFDGAKQGIAVWLWAIIIGVVLAIIAAIVGSNFLGNAGGVLSSVPVNPSQLTTGGIISLLLLLLVSLAGAVLGGLSGMRYHRRIDNTVYA